MEQLDEVIRILGILKKNPNRTYSEETIRKRLARLNEIRVEFKDNIKNSNTKHTSQTIVKFLDIIKEIKDWLQNHKKNILEEDNSDSDEETKTHIMTSNLSLDTALKAIPIFNGNHRELDSFLAISKILYNSANDAGKIQLMQIILNIKLSEKVKNSINSLPKPETITDLSGILKKIYKNPLTLPQVLSKLSTIFQGKQSISNFKDRIVTTINELNNLQISHLGDNATQEQKDTVIKINETQALHIFKNGLEESFKSTVFAAQPKTFNEAVDIATDIENTTSHSVMYMNSNNFNRNHYNNNRYNNNNNNYNRNNNNNYNRNNNNNYNGNNNNNFNRNNNNFENRNYAQNDNNRTRIRVVNQDSDVNVHEQQQEHYEHQGN